MRRRLQARVPAHAAARQEGDPLGAEEPAGGLREVARVRILRDEQRQRAVEVLVQRGREQRQRRLGHAGTRRQRLRELLQTIGSEQLADEAEEDWALFDLPDHEL